MISFHFQDPAGIFELIEVVGNGTYGQVYKVRNCVFYNINLNCIVLPVPAQRQNLYCRFTKKLWFYYRWGLIMESFLDIPLKKLWLSNDNAIAFVECYPHTTFISTVKCNHLSVASYCGIIDHTVGFDAWKLRRIREY